MRIRVVAIALALGIGGTAGLLAQSAASSGYLTPPKEIVDILDAEPIPTVTVGPNRDTLVVVSRRGMPTIAEVSQPMLRLAGMRINPRNNGPHRAPAGTGITLRTIVGGAERKLAVPAGREDRRLSFSPDGKRFIFTNTRDTRIDLYIADVATGQMQDRGRRVVNGLASECEWLDDSSGLLCGFVPAGRGAGAAEPKAPSGPNIQENYGKPGPVRTYEDC